MEVKLSHCYVATQRARFPRNLEEWDEGCWTWERWDRQHLQVYIWVSHSCFYGFFWQQSMHPKYIHFFLTTVQTISCGFNPVYKKSRLFPPAPPFLPCWRNQVHGCLLKVKVEILTGLEVNIVILCLRGSAYSLGNRVNGNCSTGAKAIFHRQVGSGECLERLPAAWIFLCTAGPGLSLSAGGLYF